MKKGAMGIRESTQRRDARFCISPFQEIQIREAGKHRYKEQRRVVIYIFVK